MKSLRIAFLKNTLHSSGGLEKYCLRLFNALQARGLEPERLERLIAATLADEKRRVTDVLEALASRVGEAQRDLSREVISPAIKSAMTPVYNACNAETGSGQFSRMKALMASHVDRNKGTMFSSAGASMEDKLRELAATLRATAAQMMVAVVERLPTHFSILWEKPQSTPTQRAGTLIQLEKLAEKADELCGRAGAVAADRAALIVAASAAEAVLQRMQEQQQARAAEIEQAEEEEEEEAREVDDMEEDEEEEEEEDMEECDMKEYGMEDCDIEGEEEEEEESEEEEEDDDDEAESSEDANNKENDAKAAAMNGVHVGPVEGVKIKAEPGLKAAVDHGEVISLISDDEGQ